MAFCVKCGKEMKDGAKFCPSCGAQTSGGVPQPVAQPAAQSAVQSRTVTVGQVKKCPSCGMPIESFQARCPSCGFELNAAQVVSSLKEFTDKLQKSADDDDYEIRNSLIENFPIPNNREDLLEFAILVYTHYKDDLERDLGTGYHFRLKTSIWYKKWTQIILKARMILANDPASLSQITTLNDEIAALDKKANETVAKAKTKRKAGCIIAIVAFVVFTVFIYWLMYALAGKTDL
ncbi:MAG: zinc-ribbon domain-containing protein [Spirochaetales bacterium]|jgi:uncharacterized membrane protein YvbJ|nr:zinc-ribbon domain-containing protein [Spirochaetales bacterium]